MADYCKEKHHHSQDPYGTNAKFDDWHSSLCCDSCDECCQHKEWERIAYGAGYHRAIEDTGHNAKPMAKQKIK